MNTFSHLENAEENDQDLQVYKTYYTNGSIACEDFFRNNQLEKSIFYNDCSVKKCDCGGNC